MNEIEKLWKASEIADARLEIAEIFAWPMAGLATALIWLIFESWIFALVAFPIGFYSSSYALRKESTATEEAYMKASKTGRYIEDTQKKHDQS